MQSKNHPNFTSVFFLINLLKILSETVKRNVISLKYVSKSGNDSLFIHELMEPVF